LALEALASGAVKACFDLLLCSLAIRTGKHVKLYNIVRLVLDSPSEVLYGGLRPDYYTY
jgi:hypothetical protein